MAVTITLDDIEVVSWMIDVPHRRIEVNYAIKISDGDIHTYGEAIFWETLPDQPIDPITEEPEPYPDNWYEIPGGTAPTGTYVEVLVALTGLIRQALLHLINE